MLCGSGLSGACCWNPGALARYHRPELNDCLVISDATPPQPCSVPPSPPDAAASLPLSVRLRATLLEEGGGETQHRLHTPARSKHLKLLDNRTFPPTYKHSDYTFPHTAAALLRPQISVGPAEISVQTLPGADLTLLINWLQALLKHNISYGCSSGWMYSLKRTFRAKMNALPRLKNALLTLFPPSSSPNQNYKKTLKRSEGAEGTTDNLLSVFPLTFFSTWFRYWCFFRAPRRPMRCELSLREDRPLFSALPPPPKKRPHPAMWRQWVFLFFTAKY